MGKRRLKSCVAKRITSILLAAAMAVSTPVGTLFNANSVAKAADETSIANASFETDIWATGNGWTCSKTNEDDSINWVTYADKRTSAPDGDENNEYAVNVWSASTDSSFTFTQEISLKTGKYKFSFNGMGDDVEYYIAVNDTEGTKVASSGWENWNKATVKYTAESDTTVTLKLVVTTTAASGWGYIDCVSWTYSDLNSENDKFELYYYYEGESENLYIDLWNQECLKFVDGTTETADPFTWNKYLAELVPDTENENWYYTTFEIEDSSVSSGFDVYDSSNNNLFKCDSTTNYKDIFSEIVNAENSSKLYITDNNLFANIEDANYYNDSSKRTFTIDTTPSAQSEISSEKLYVEKVEISDDFITGFDISSYWAIRQSGTTYKDAEGNELDDAGFFALLKDSGVNWVRIRVWVDPTDGNGHTYGGGCNDLNTAIYLGKLATSANLKVLIDFHYSDFWTDPSKQTTPKSWAEYDGDIDAKAAKLKTYTENSLKTLIVDNEINVGMVQIGNETNNGICGETTKVNMCKLFAAGSEAVRNIESSYNKNIMIAIHVADPQSLDFGSYAASLKANHVVYDVFATSYYPYFHGDLDNLYNKLSTIATTYNKYVMVAETSYAWTLEDGDGHENSRSESSYSKNEFFYPIGYQGQLLHVRNVVEKVASIKVNDEQKGIGVFYWEPAWIPVQHYDANEDDAAEVLASNKSKWESDGSGWATSYAANYDKDVGTWYGGSAVDNEGVFDFDGKALETIQMFNMIRGGTTASNYVVEASDISASFVLDEEVVLPDTVKVVYANGDTDDADVTWNDDEIEAAIDSGEGEYNISGTASYNEESYPVKCRLTLSPVNLLVNPSFEDSLTGNWVLDDSGIARKSASQDSNNNIRTGSYNLHFNRTNDGGHTFYQTITLDKGIYRAGGYVSGEANSYDTQILLYFTIGDDEYTSEGSMTGWGNWSNPEIKDIKISEDNTEVTIGIRATGFGASAWGAYEDFYIYKTGDIEDTDDNTGDEDNTDDNTDKDTSDDGTDKDNPDDNTDKDTTDDGTDKDTTDDGTDKDNPDDGTDKETTDDVTDKDVKDDSTDKDTTDKDKKDDAKVEDKKDDTKVEDEKDIPEGEKFANYQSCDFYEDEDGNITCYDSKGKQVIDDFKCDGEFTYYFQFDGTAMKDRLTYHPDGIHVIYFDENGHEVFNDFAHVKRSIAGEEVDDYCFFDVFGYLYVDVITWDKTGTVLYYANPYGVLEMGKWFQFSDTVKWGDGRETEGIAGGYGYATEDGTLMTNQFTYDWEGNFCYMQGNGTILR